MVKLIHSIDGTMYREYPLEKGRLTVGRELDNDIRLDDDAVSSHHAEIVVKASKYMEGFLDVWAVDLDSTNGTLINGKPVKKQMLHHDDDLKIGTHRFKFVDLSAGGISKTTRILIEEGD